MKNLLRKSPVRALHNVKALYKCVPAAALLALSVGFLSPSLQAADINIDVASAEERETVTRYKVNSLAADAYIDGNQLILLMSDLQEALKPDATKDDKLLALASYVLAAQLDKMLIHANKFEKVPRYRVTHVVNSIINQYRYGPRESNVLVYERIVDLWRKACEPRIADGKTCDFTFRFDKKDWKIGSPTFSRTFPLSTISHITDSITLQMYRGSILDNVGDVLNKGFARISIAGLEKVVRKKEGDTKETVTQRVTSAWKELRIAADYLVIDTNYIKEVYGTEIRSILKEFSESGVQKLKVNIGGISEEIEFEERLQGRELREATAEAIRKIHTQRFFGTNPDEVVLVKRADVNNAIFQHQWDGFVMKLEDAPKDYYAFVNAVEEHLDRIYIERTRKKMMNYLVGSELDPYYHYVPPREMNQRLSQYKAFEKKGLFSFIDLPLADDENSEVLKNAANLIASKVSDALSEGKGREGLLEKVVQEVNVELNTELTSYNAEHSAILSPVLENPTQSRELQLFQMLFSEEIIQRGVEEGQEPSLVYFFDRERKAISFVLRVSAEQPQEKKLSLSMEGINRDKIKEEIEQQKFINAYRDAVLKVFNKDTLVLIKDHEFFELDERPSIEETHELLVGAIRKYVTNSDAMFAGSGWSNFVRFAYRAPLKPSEFKVAPPKMEQKSFLESLFGG